MKEKTIKHIQMNKLNTLFVFCNQHFEFSVTISPMTSNNILIISLIIINKYNKDKYKDNTLGYILIKKTITNRKLSLYFYNPTY